MSIVRTYQMASRSNDAELRAALVALAHRIMDQPGCEGIDLIDPVDTPGVTVMAEYWRDEAARVAAGQTLGREAFAEVIALCADVRITDGSVFSESTENERWWRRPFTISTTKEGKTE